MDGAPSQGSSLHRSGSPSLGFPGASPAAQDTYPGQGTVTQLPYVCFAGHPANAQTLKTQSVFRSRKSKSILAVTVVPVPRAIWQLQDRR